MQYLSRISTCYEFVMERSSKWNEWNDIKWNHMEKVTSISIQSIQMYISFKNATRSNSSVRFQISTWIVIFYLRMTHDRRSFSSKNWFSSLHIVSKNSRRFIFSRPKCTISLNVIISNWNIKTQHTFYSLAYVIFSWAFFLLFTQSKIVCSSFSFASKCFQVFFCFRELFVRFPLCIEMVIFNAWARNWGISVQDF